MEKITLSIFVPCFNEERNITNTLNNIQNGIIGINYEILVVDDASKDKTIEMIEKFKKNKYFMLSPKGKKYLRIFKTAQSIYLIKFSG